MQCSPRIWREQPGLLRPSRRNSCPKSQSAAKRTKRDTTLSKQGTLAHLHFFWVEHTQQLFRDDLMRMKHETTRDAAREPLKIRE